MHFMNVKSHTHLVRHVFSPAVRCTRWWRTSLQITWYRRCLTSRSLSNARCSCTRSAHTYPPCASTRTANTSSPSWRSTISRAALNLGPSVCLPTGLCRKYTGQGQTRHWHAAEWGSTVIVIVLDRGPTEHAFQRSSYLKRAISFGHRDESNCRTPVAFGLFGTGVCMF